MSNQLIQRRILADKLVAFARERDWEKFHTPKNLVMALAGEISELHAVIGAAMPPVRPPPDFRKQFEHYTPPEEVALLEQEYADAMKSRLEEPEEPGPYDKFLKAELGDVVIYLVRLESILGFELTEFRPLGPPLLGLDVKDELIIAAGRLLAEFQWLSDADVQHLPDKSKTRVRQLIDLIWSYVASLAFGKQWDLMTLADDKMLINAQKYPAEMVYGTAKKYTEY